jgi:uncharacterized protein
MNNNHFEKIELKINGTHCSACEVLIERKFRRVPGVEKVRVNYTTGRTILLCSQKLDTQELERLIAPHGYTTTGQAMVRNSKKDYLQIGAIFLIIVALYLVLRQLHVVPDVGVSDTMGYGAVFVIGLVAAISTCMAVAGGLLLAVAAKYNEQHPELTGVQRFRAHLYFNAGRVASYTILGGAVGALGSVLSVSSTVNGIVTIIVSLVMAILGLQLLNIFPWLSRLQPRMPKFIAHKIYDASSRQGKAAPLLFGALTFFLPCGFTQALQLYVLSKGSFATGAVTMLIFSLGTLPALLSVSVVSSFLKGAWQKHFLKFAGVVVVLVGILSLSRGFALAGITVVSTGSPRTDTQEQANTVGTDIVPDENGVQVVKMTVDGYNYSPAHFTVKKGVPVEWQIDGRKAAGCAGVITMPKMNITEMLPRNSIKTIRFTPTETGTLNFSCTMGMTTPGAAFTVVESGVDADGSANTNTPSGTKDLSKCDPRTAMCLTN